MVLIGSSHRTDHQEERLSHTAFVCQFEMVDIRKAEDDCRISKRLGRSHHFDLVADFKPRTRLPGVDDAHELTQRVSTVIVGVIGIQVVVVRGLCCRNACRFKLRVCVDIFLYIRRCDTPSSEDIVAGDVGNIACILAIVIDLHDRGLEQR